MWNDQILEDELKPTFCLCHKHSTVPEIFRVFNTIFIFNHLLGSWYLKKKKKISIETNIACSH